MHKRGLNSIDHIARVLPHQPFWTRILVHNNSPFPTLSSAAKLLHRGTAITTGVGLIPPVLKWLSLIRHLVAAFIGSGENTKPALIKFALQLSCATSS